MKNQNVKLLPRKKKIMNRIEVISVHNMPCTIWHKSTDQCTSWPIKQHNWIKRMEGVENIWSESVKSALIWFTHTKMNEKKKKTNQKLHTKNGTMQNQIRTEERKQNKNEIVKLNQNTTATRLFFKYHNISKSCSPQIQYLANWMNIDWIVNAKNWPI